MLLRMGVNMDLHPIMRVVLKYADRAFTQHTNREAIINSARDREHGSGSWHYYGLAVDFKTKDLDAAQIRVIVAYLRAKLPDFDVVQERFHLHIEIGDGLAAKLGLNL